MSNSSNLQKVVKYLKKNNLKIVTAESCTGGLIAKNLTDLAGSSSYFERGYVTYSNDSKIQLLTVPTRFIEDFGAVSKEVAISMAEGALLMSEANIAISVTGIAGPDSDDSSKPVGLVYIAKAQRDKNTIYKKFNFTGTREEIRHQTMIEAFNIVIK